MANPHTKINNAYKATRPRHMLGNDPRKLVGHYEVMPPYAGAMILISALLVFSGVFVGALWALHII